MTFVFVDWEKVEDLAVRYQSLSKYGKKRPPAGVKESDVRMLANAALFALAVKDILDSKKTRKA